MDESQSRRRTLLVCLGLTLAIVAAYSPVWHCQFVLYDDNDYVTANDMVKQGLTWRGIAWAFTTFHAGNWHPLTWISHMVDVQIFGLNPAAHHMTNVMFHIANSLLLFLLLQRMTKAMPPSALVAAFFALHPLHVESVAWVSERKDVLSAFFFLLTLWNYVRYTEESAAKNRRAGFFYAGSIVLFALGLMAKPMLVTLPFVLLLLDYWPLQRFQRPTVKLFAEKVPYLILAAAACAVTLRAQLSEAALSSLAGLPFHLRVQLALVAYARYAGKTFWPVHLAVLYPLPRRWPLCPPICAAAFLALITTWVGLRIRTQRHLAVGWFWFLGMLVPVIGLVHVGGLAMADRYHYLPGIGLFIMIVWAVRDCTAALGARIQCVMAGVALLGCMAVTMVQTGYWKDSVTLFAHALAVTEDNSLMENNLGKVLSMDGRMDEAQPHLRRALELAPTFAEAHYNLGNVYLATGRVADALTEFETHVRLLPGNFIGQYNFGSVLLDQGLARASLSHLQKAVELRPADTSARLKLAGAFRQAGLPREAASQYEELIRLRPDWLPPVAALAWMLSTNPDPAPRDGRRAVQLALEARQLSAGQDARVLGILGAAYAEAGDFSNATTTAQQALRLAEANRDTALMDTLHAQLARYGSGLPFRDAPPASNKQ